MLPLWRKNLPHSFRRHITVILTSLGMLCNMLLYSGVTAFTQRVTVNDNGVISSFLSFSKDSQTILEENGYETGENDEIITVINDNNIDITIDRAVTVSILTYGETKTVEVRSNSTVANALSVASVLLDDNDVVSCDPNAIVYDGMEIAVQQISYSTYTVDETLPYQQIRQETNELYQGETKLQTPGQNGILTHYYQNTVVDGTVTQTQEVGYNVTTPVIDEIILVGTKPRITQSPAKGKGKSQLTIPAAVSLDNNGIPTSYSKVITGRACAYTGGGNTSTGKAAAPGYVAVNPNVIPYGTQMYIVSEDGYVYGYAIAADTGGSCMINDILVDLYMNTEQECTNFGSRTVNVYIL